MNLSLQGPAWTLASLIMMSASAIGQGGMGQSGRRQEIGAAPTLHVVNGVSHDLGSLFLTSPPQFDAHRPLSRLLGPPSSVRIDQDRILIPIQRPLSSPPTHFGGISVLDRRGGWTLFQRSLAGWVHNPIDVVALPGDVLVVSNLLSFDLVNQDYRLTFLHRLSLQPWLTLPIPNPHAQAPDPSLSPSGMVLHDRWLFICCSGFSFNTFGYPNPGTVIVFDTQGGGFVDTDGDSSNGITPLVMDLPNPNRAKVGPDGDLYVVCSSNYGAFSGGHHISGGVEVFALPSFDKKAVLDFGGDSAPASLHFTTDGRGYCGDSIQAWVYSFDFTQDVVLRDAIHNPLTLSTTGALGLVSDFYPLDSQQVLALEFNREKIYHWRLDDDDNQTDPSISIYKDLNPQGGSFSGPQFLIPSRD